MATMANKNTEATPGTEEDPHCAPATPDENPETTSTKDVPLRRSNRGKGRAEKSDERMQSCLAGSVEYKTGDYVYYEEADLDFYAIGLIDEIKLSRREKCSLIIKCFFRTGDVPDISKQALLDREGTEKGDPRILTRELFGSELQSNVTPDFLRGKCHIVQLPDVHVALKNFDPTADDSFFYVYMYNPETKRLATTRAEIKASYMFSGQKSYGPNDYDNY